MAALQVEHHGPGSHSTRLSRSLSVFLFSWLVLSGAAHAGDPWEFWPELSGFLTLSPGTRIYLDVPYAEGKGGNTWQLDLGAYLDISIKPVLPRPRYRNVADWQRSRLFWARVGYVHVARTTEGTRSPSEDRVVLSFWHKFYLPANVWLEGRERADLRWIGGEYSTRYRLRLEATREFTVRNHPVVPYLNYEWFYDTRYDAWTRTLLQAGSEITVNKHFRYELFLARQTDRQPTASAVNAFGVVAKWYY